jgi:hypothetical protein
VTRTGSTWDREFRLLRNAAFMEEAHRLAAMRPLYGVNAPGS